jgi:hypothetical protein
LEENTMNRPKVKFSSRVGLRSRCPQEEGNMSRLKVVASALVIPVALVMVLSQGILSAEAQTDRKVYSAKFLCGEFQPTGVCVSGPVGAPCQTDADCPSPGGPGICEPREGPVKPGNYQTAINVVNPTRKPILFVKKAVLLYSNDPDKPVPTPGTFEEPQPPGPIFSAFLEENWGLEIDCPDIRIQLLGLPPPPNEGPPSFIKGFVEVEVFDPDEQLDIVAAYTTHGFTGSNVCSLPGSPLDGQPCDPNLATDLCLASGGLCVPGPISEEGFSIDVEEVEATEQDLTTSAFHRKVQSAKFLCGEFQPLDLDGDGIPDEGPVKPGNYETAINVVNPTRKPITFVKKAVLLYDSRQPPTDHETPRPPGPLFTAHLEPNWGMEIDCPDIRQVLLQQLPPGATPPFLKGYVVIETFVSDEVLDVVAAYTSHGFTGVFGNVCSLPGSSLDGLPCDPNDAADPCIESGGVCSAQVVATVPEGFSIDVEDVKEKVSQ